MIALRVLSLSQDRFAEPTLTVGFKVSSDIPLAGFHFEERPLRGELPDKHVRVAAVWLDVPILCSAVAPRAERMHSNVCTTTAACAVLSWCAAKVLA